MKKRRVIPVVAAGGLLAFLASQFLSLNLGVTQSDSSVVDPDAEESSTTTSVVSVEEPSLLADAKLWLIDVLIDGDTYSVRKVTDQTGGQESERVIMSVTDIVSAVDDAEGDASGTKLRISRTPEALASAAKKLTTALDEAGIAADVIETRQRLVE